MPDEKPEEQADAQCGEDADQTSCDEKVPCALSSQPRYSMENRRVGNYKIGILLDRVIERTKASHVGGLPPHGAFVVIPSKRVEDFMKRPERESNAA